MAARCFPNIMPAFVEEDPTLGRKIPQADEIPRPGTEDFVKKNQTLEGKIPKAGEIPRPGTEESILRLLAKPHASLSEDFKRVALDLKQTILVQTWGLTGQKAHDCTLYSGVLGTAFLLFKSYEVTQIGDDLGLCCHILKACDSASLHSNSSGEVTFIFGRAGVCALGAVVTKIVGDDRMHSYYMERFKEITLSKDLPDELLYGRAGYLWGCQFINRHLGKGTISLAEMGDVVKEIVGNGRKMGGRGGSPLMFKWQGNLYWGAAHGLAGIMHVLMDSELKPDERKDVKETLKYMIKNRFHSGNYPVSEADRQRDISVNWCHGAPGITLTLVKAAEVFGDEVFLQAAIDAAEVVWNRGLLKRVGICHGISGNAYVFLALYRLTGEVKFLYRAKAFSCFLLEKAHKLIGEGEMHGGDHPYSLFEGIGGMAYLLLDMVEPANARFPAYEQ